MYSIPLANRIATDCIFVHLEVTKWWSFVNFAKKPIFFIFFRCQTSECVVSNMFFVSVNTDRLVSDANVKQIVYRVECWRHNIMISISTQPKQSKQNSDDDDWSHVSNEWYIRHKLTRRNIHSWVHDLFGIFELVCLCMFVSTTKCDRIASKIFE